MPDPQQAWALLENSDPISSADEVQAAIEIGSEFSRNAQASFGSGIARF